MSPSPQRPASLQPHAEPAEPALITDQPERLGRSRRLWLFRLTASAGSLVATLVILEVLLRFFSPPAPPIPYESADNAARVDNSRNAINLRERWDRVPGDETACRIAFLGDSFTYAACVEQEEGFVHQVESLLNGPGPLRSVTINIGQPGTEPQAQSEIYAALKDQLHPDVLVHVLYCNDLGHDLYDELKLIHALQNRTGWPADYSYLWRFVEQRIRYEMVMGRTLDYFRGGDSPFKRRQAWQRLRSGVEAAKSLTDADGTRYCLVLFPWLFRLDDYPLQDVHQRMRRLADELQVPFLDLLDTFRGRDAARMRISVIDEHPTPQAHALAAEAITRFLGDQDLLCP